MRRCNMIEKLEVLLKSAFKAANYPVDDIRIIKSNRPDLCDFQCDDVFKLTKIYHKNPIEIGEEVVTKINETSNFNDYFNKVEFVKPGFINISLSNKFINDNIRAIQEDISYDLK